MATEAFDYRKIKEIEAFTEELRFTDESNLHPTLKRKAIEAARIMEEAASLKFPENLDPRLLPSPADQPLLLTPYDNFEGMKPVVASEEIIEGWKITYDYNLGLANHPARIRSMQLLEEKGFVPPQPFSEPTIFSKSKDDATKLLQLSDVGHNIDLLEMADPSVYSSHETPEQRDAFSKQVEERKQVHRTPLFATGVHNMVGRQARSFFGVGAMPDINGTALGLATYAMMHAISEVPEVGYFSDPSKQAALAKEALSLLTTNNPLLDGRSQEEKEYIVRHWRNNIVGVLEVDPEKALKRAEKLAAVGVRTLRVYGHTQGGEIATTVRLLRKEYPDFEIFGSQVIDLYTAEACEYNGANGIITGVGFGGRCTTAERAQSISATAVFVENCRKARLGIPIIGEGGAIDEPVIAALIGLTAVNGSGSMGGAAIESPGGITYLSDGVNLLKPYGGEASARTKWISARLYKTGIPYFAEGEETFRPLVPLFESATQRFVGHQERLILGGLTLRLDSGPFLVQEMNNLNPSPLFEKSYTTQYLQRSH